MGCTDAIEALRREGFFRYTPESMIGPVLDEIVRTGDPLHEATGREAMLDLENFVEQGMPALSELIEACKLRNVPPTQFEHFWFEGGTFWIALAGREIPVCNTREIRDDRWGTIARRLLQEIEGLVTQHSPDRLYADPGYNDTLVAFLTPEMYAILSNKEYGLQCRVVPLEAISD